MTEVIQSATEVNVPVRTAYNQWTQFEEFPQFMEGVESVTQLTDDRLRWIAEIGGQRRQWEARITEQEPDMRVGWTSEEGALTAGAVDFHKIDPNTTRVTLEMKFEPQDWMEKAADVLGVVQRRVKGDLERFKEFIESRGQETGAWRGRIDQEKTA